MFRKPIGRKQTCAVFRKWGRTRKVQAVILFSCSIMLMSYMFCFCVFCALQGWNYSKPQSGEVGVQEYSLLLSLGLLCVLFCWQAEPIAMDEKSITYKSISSPRRIHKQLVQERITTMDKLLRFITKKFHNRRCLGTRQILAEEDEIQKDGRIFKKVIWLNGLLWLMCMPRRGG